MDQEAWNQIYNDLESDIAAQTKRGGSVSDLDVILAIDKARFAMERGDNDEAIARIQDVKRLLGSDGGVTRGGPASAGLDRLDALEDNLHSTVRLGSARLEITGEEEEEPTRAASQNTKVNKSLNYDDVKDEIQRMWNACKIRPEKASAVRSEADRVVANRKVYEGISAKTQVPWWFIGLIHGMECSFSLSKHLHNGDSLKARTWQVPAGRPKDGSPPFTFEASAIDALQVDGFAGKTDWPLTMVLFRLERYNGFGYRKKFGFASPYLWSYTNHFTSGKYVKDGVFDANATSKQCGAAAMLQDLVQRGVVTLDEKAAEPVVAVAPKPAPAPVPAPAPAPAATPAPTPVEVAVAELSASSKPVVTPAVTAVEPAPVPTPPVAAPVAAPVAPVVQPAAQPAAAAPSPAPVVNTPATPVPPAPVAPVVAPAAAAGPVAPPVPTPAPVAPVAAAPVPPAPVAPPATPVAPPVAPPAAAAAAAPGAPGASLGDAVSPAVAAALAELAKRSK